MNVMTFDGYHAKIEHDEALDLFRGEISTNRTWLRCSTAAGS
jgi:predicted HicB family RNase H-like nuclease